MQPSLEKLYKFFKLESERGYDNRAVVGGLNKILPGWESEARADRLPDETIQLILRNLNEYPDLEPEKRAQTLRELWRTISGGKTENRSDLPRPKRQSEPTVQANRPTATAPKKEAKDESTLRKTPPARRLRNLLDHNAENAPFAELGLNAPLTVLPGIGPKNAKTLSPLGLNTLGDLLYYFPRRYDDYSQLEPIVRLMYGEAVTVIGTIQSIETRPIRGGSTKITEAIVSDGTGNLRVTWFNQPWLSNKLKPGTALSLSGEVSQYLGRITMSNPDWDLIDKQNLSTNRIVPVYPLTTGVTQQSLRRLVQPTVEYWSERLPDYLPDRVKESASLVDLGTALQEIHYPHGIDDLKAARERLAFDEIFLLQLGVLKQKFAWQQATARVYQTEPAWLDQYIQTLPFPLTGAQNRAIEEIRQDLLSGKSMNRLLQGDVGSGKTVVAALAIAMVLRHGVQAALMAPTSILAEQLYRNLSRILAGETDNSLINNEQIRLLVGATPESEKEQIRSGLVDGTIKVVIGTHALLEADVQFNDLQMVVVDEQHRFGVAQRAVLRTKGDNPHLLVMTATPIPRSLALTVYGDLDLSVMDEIPAGRQPIETHLLYPLERERAYSLIQSQIDQGFQAFIIYPLVEGGEGDESKAAVDEYQRIQNEIFPKLKVGLLHGRLKPDEKDTVMAGFRDREYQILVSTSVIEVGVDIPNATVMLVEGANRFGLAQLHQFRGRVGRGEGKSFCLLIPETDDGVENARLNALVESNDGFVLAEKDLQQRGPGDFLGKRQSGFAELKMASLTDVRLIEKARQQAQSIFQVDPNLESPEYQLLQNALKRFWIAGSGDIS